MSYYKGYATRVYAVPVLAVGDLTAPQDVVAVTRLWEVMQTIRDNCFHLVRETLMRARVVEREEDLLVRGLDPVGDLWMRTGWSLDFLGPGNNRVVSWKVPATMAVAVYGVFDLSALLLVANFTLLSGNEPKGTYTLDAMYGLRTGMSLLSTPVVYRPDDILNLDVVAKQAADDYPFGLLALVGEPLVKEVPGGPQVQGEPIGPG